MSNTNTFTVTCPDGHQRHHDTFPTQSAAEEFAEWGHVCLATNKHTIERNAMTTPEIEDFGQWPVRVDVSAIDADLIGRLATSGTVMNHTWCLVPRSLWLALREVASSTSQHWTSSRDARSLLRRIDYNRTHQPAFEVLAIVNPAECNYCGVEHDLKGGHRTISERVADDLTSLECTHCGSVGNAEDLAFLGEACPRAEYEDDSCDGVMMLDVSAS